MNGARSKWASALAGVALVVAWAGGAMAAGPKVYVADEEANTVSVLDAVSLRKVGSIAVGRKPHNVQVSPDGKYAWVTNNGEATKSGAEHAHEAMPKSEHEMMAGNGEVWVIDTGSEAVVDKIQVGMHPAHVVLTPDGRFAYVTNGGDNTVSVIDTMAQRQIGTIAVGAYPHGIRLSPDGKQAYVANLKGATVSVLDTEGRKEAAQIPVGKGPAQVGFTADGRLAFVSLSEEDKVALIDPVTRKVISKVAVGTVPIQVYATPDSRTLLVANQGTRKKPGTTVSVVDLATLKTARTIETGSGAHGVAIDRDGRYAYVTNIYANSVAVIDVNAGKVVATVAVGRGPNGVSVKP